MNYPFWDVPAIGSTWVIGGIAIFHVLVSHFAIGGGFYLPMAERKALREGRDDWMQVIKGHAKFFLVLTSVFGAVTGVAIWFAIGLANPEGTSTLIHNFVFGWAIEWTFFIVEIAAAMVYYYTWDKVDHKTHLRVGWVYAITAWLSLVIINGILTFMLTPGEAWLAVAGTGNEASRFWHAFFNPTYWPSLVLRTLICISLAGIWAFVTASRIDARTQGPLKAEVMRWSARWLMPAYLIIPLAFFWYLNQIPEARLQLLQFGITTIGQGTFTQVTRVALISIMTSGTIAAVVYFLAYRNPRDFSFGHALGLLFLALIATASTEYARETLRKPYVISDHMFSNGIRKADVARINEEGYLKHSPWATAEMRAAWDANTASPESAHLRGQLVFRGQCMACHTEDGYRSMKRMLAGRDRQAIGNMLQILHAYAEDSPYRAYMPPLAGTAEEVNALGDYLALLVAPPEEGEKEALATKQPLAAATGN
jgi:cytochrome d ubiquinol oxidase subunit I